MHEARRTRRWATTAVLRHFAEGVSIAEITSRAYAPRGVVLPRSWAYSPAGLSAQMRIEDVIRRALRRRGPSTWRRT